MSTRLTRLTLRLAGLTLLGSLGTSAAGAQTLNFDNVGGTYAYVGSTYSPYVFGGTAQVVQDGGGYGVLGCATSGQYCLYNGNGDQNVTLSRNDAQAFSLTSGYFTSWFGSTGATVVGSLNGAQVFSQSFALGGSAALQTFSSAPVDLVSFYASGPSSYFLADDITVSAVTGGPTSTAPEPATLALLAGGLAALGLARRTRWT